VEAEKEIAFMENEKVEGKTTKDMVSLKMKCKFCGRDITINMHPSSKKSIECKDGENVGVLAVFDCRGCDLLKWVPKQGISAVAAETGTAFPEVDFSDIWTDYDEVSKKNCLIEYKGSTFGKA